MPLLLLLLLSALLLSPYGTLATAELDLDTCSSAQQERILPGLLGCEPRPALVPLTLPNASYVHVMPGHVVVDRCGGSCLIR